MARQRQMLDWDRTAALLCVAYNLTRDPRHSRAMSPVDFNPYRKNDGVGAVAISTPEEAVGFFRSFASALTQ